MLESRTSAAGKLKESETSRQLTEDVITKLDTNALYHEEHELHSTHHSGSTDSNSFQNNFPNTLDL